MRSGDFAVEVIPSGGERVRELESGHVLARPGTVYRLRLRNFGPLRCVAAIEIDGRSVSEGGLVLDPWSLTDLERPMNDGEDGCFTVVAEGDEAVFGPDGGRDNESLGLIDVHFRRELPVVTAYRPLPPPVSDPFPRNDSDRFDLGESARFECFLSDPAESYVDSGSEVERAAGTGLTGHSDQYFVMTSLGPLEPEATVIQLRLVIASEAAIADGPMHAPVSRPAPARPAARP